MNILDRHQQPVINDRNRTVIVKSWSPVTEVIPKVKKKESVVCRKDQSRNSLKIDTKYKSWYIFVHSIIQEVESELHIFSYELSFHESSLGRAYFQR